MMPHAPHAPSHGNGHLHYRAPGVNTRRTELEDIIAGALDRLQVKGEGDKGSDGGYGQSGMSRAAPLSAPRPHESLYVSSVAHTMRAPPATQPARQRGGVGLMDRLYSSGRGGDTGRESVHSGRETRRLDESGPVSTGSLSFGLDTRNTARPIPIPGSQRERRAERESVMAHAGSVSLSSPLYEGEREAGGEGCLAESMGWGRGDETRHHGSSVPLYATGAYATSTGRTGLQSKGERPSTTHRGQTGRGVRETSRVSRATPMASRGTKGTKGSRRAGGGTKVQATPSASVPRGQRPPSAVRQRRRATGEGTPREAATGRGGRASPGVAKRGEGKGERVSGSEALEADNARLRELLTQQYDRYEDIVNTLAASERDRHRWVGEGVLGMSSPGVRQELEGERERREAAKAQGVAEMNHEVVKMRKQCAKTAAEADSLRQSLTSMQKDKTSMVSRHKREMLGALRRLKYLVQEVKASRAKEAEADAYRRKLETRLLKQQADVQRLTKGHAQVHRLLVAERERVVQLERERDAEREEAAHLRTALAQVREQLVQVESHPVRSHSRSASRSLSPSLSPSYPLPRSQLDMSPLTSAEYSQHRHRDHSQSLGLASTVMERGGRGSRSVSRTASASRGVSYSMGAEGAEVVSPEPDTTGSILPASPMERERGTVNDTALYEEGDREEGEREHGEEEEEEGYDDLGGTQVNVNTGGADGGGEGDLPGFDSPQAPSPSTTTAAAESGVSTGERDALDIGLDPDDLMSLSLSAIEAEMHNMGIDADDGLSHNVTLGGGSAGRDDVSLLSEGDPDSEGDRVDEVEMLLRD
ncbi:hypothetical protein KIPB_005494 [Kipferlia bialata]|uniref:Lebercilin domain-containing protein n=1 Tax=Kipferlia bialata TaxID=797122 RepID=A0A9K3CYL0_9EUKA|nr:hypothetical protein KIPB_005494 [Kipferlia bialata]|eukprot:g5494.t1